MKNSSPRSNSFLDLTSLAKYLILLFLIVAFAVDTATAQCGLGTASQVTVPPTMTGAADATWASATVNIIGANPNNTVSNNSANQPLSSTLGTNDGFPQLATNTSREPGFSATWQAQWTNTTLYILVQVTDPTVNFDPIPNDQFFYNYDAVEVYLSGNNNHGGAPYGADDVQYGFSNGVYRGIGGGSGAGSSTVGVIGTDILTGVGYNMAITIPLSSFSAPGTMNSQVSFDIAVDDNDHLPNIFTKMTQDSTDLVNLYGQSPANAHIGVLGFESGGDYRDAQVAWHGTTGQALYNTPSELGNLVLTAPPTTATAHNQSICGSGIITLAGNAPLIGMGQWTATGGLANLSQLSGGTNNPTATFNSAGLGTYIFTWSILNNPCSATPSTANDTISVTPLPLLLITNPPAVCSPGTVDITAPAVTAGSSGGTTLTYFTDPSTTIPLATPTAVATSGTYYIKSTSTSNCITVTPVTVTINISPVITVTSANPTACLSSTGSFTVNGLISGTVYTINFDAGGVAQTPQTLTANAGGTVTVTGLPAGSYTNIIAVPPAGCVSNAGSATLTDPAAPTPTASTGGIVCAGGNLTLASTLTAGATYTWIGPGGYTATGATQTISPATLADSGLYTVTVTLAGCVGTSSVVGTVNPTPVLVITNPAAVCAPGGIDITAPAVTVGSTLPTGTVLSYYTNPGGTISVATPTNITTSGTYYIKAVSGLGCSVIAPVTATINPQPAIAVTSANPTACATSTGSFTVTGLTPGATYTINFDAGGVAQTPQTLIASGAGTITVTTLPAGSYTNITATSAAGCISNTSTATLTDPSAPTPTASTGGTICTGGSLTLASTLTAGATYTWTGPGGYTATGATQTISPATSADSGLYTVTVTLAGCVGTSSVVGTVNPTPVLVITNPAAVCAPSGIDITAPAVTAGSTLPTGTVLSYYTNPGGTISVATPTNITTSGTYYIKAVSGLGCSVIAPVTATINPQPAIAVTSANPTACATSTGSFTVTGLTPGATYTINFDAGGIAQTPQTLIASGAGTITVTTLPAGSYTNITATSAAGCISNTSTVTLTDPSAPTPTASTGGTICTGGSLTLASTLTAGATYTWTGPGGYTATGATQTISPATSADSGLYTVTVTLAGCVGTSSVVGTVNPTPVLVITNPAPICAPAGIDITAPAVTTGSTLPTGTVLSYYTNAGGTISVATPTNITTSGTYYIKAVSGLGCSVIAPVTATINPQPAIAVTSTNPTTCATSTGSFTLTGLTPGATYTINFDKGGIAQAPQILVANGVGIITVPTLPAGSYTNITATSAAGCASNTGTATLTDPAAPTPTAGTLGAICSGNTLSLTSTPTAGATYSWNGPNGFSSILQNPTIPAALYADSGSYTVTVTLAGCVGTSSITGVVHPTPVLTITNPTAICAPAGVDITVPAVTAGSTLSSDAVLSYYTNAAATTVLAAPTNVTTSGTYYIKALTGPGCSDVQPVTVTINPQPAIVVTSTNPTACATSTGSFTVSGLTIGATYTINFNEGGVAQSPQILIANATGAITITTLPAGSYTNITATSAAGCISNSGTATLSDPAAPTPTAGTLGAVCSGNTLSLTSTPTAGATYSWSGPNGFSSMLQNPTIPAALYADSGMYTVIVTLTGCTGTSSVDGIVNQTPVLTITNPTVICSFVSLDLTLPAITAGSTLPPGTTLSYYTNAAATIILATPTNVTASGTYYIKALTTSGCSDVEPVVVTISPLPPITVTSTNPTACATSTGTFTVNGLTSGIAYTINFDKGGVVQTPQVLTATAAGTITISGLPADNYTAITATVAAGCISNTGSATLSDPTAPTPTAGTLGAVCSGNTLSLTSTPTAGATYSWSGPNGFTSTLQNPTVPLALYADSGIYNVTVTITGCTGNSSVVGVVHPTPVLTITNPTAICAPGTVDITAPAITAGSNLSSDAVLSYYTDATATTTLATPTNVTTSGTYYIKASTGFFCSDIQPVTVTVNPLPTITGIFNVCVGNTTPLTGSAVPAAVSPWVSGTPAVATVNNTGVVTGISAGTSIITYTNSNGCTTTATITVNGLPTISGTLNVCVGNTTNLTGSGTPAAVNPWISATPAVATIDNAGVVTGVSAGSSVITYTNNNGCTTTATVTVNALPTITGTLNVCVGNTTNLTGSPTAAITNPWISANTAVATVSNTGVVSGVAGGTSVITYTNSNGCTITATVTVNALPTITGTLAVCVGSTQALTGSGIPAAVNPWLSSNPAAATIDNAGVVSGVSAGSSVITYTNNNGCVTTATVTINATPVLKIQNPNAVCSPGTVDITNPSVAINNSTLPPNTSLNYYADMAATIPVGSPQAISTSGTYYIQAIVSPSGCNTIDPVSVTINPQPAPLTPTGLNYCQGEGNIPALTANADPGNTLVWYKTVSGGPAGTTALQYPSTATGGVTLTYFVTQIDGNGCESNTRGELDVKITTLPQASISASATEIYAETPADTVNLNGSTTGSAVTVAWYQGEGFSLQVGSTNSITIAPPSSIDPPLDTTRYYFVATATENTQCADTVSVLITVIQHLLIPNIFSPNGDGVNDVWDIKNIQEFNNAEVSIFNRYGQFVYKSGDGYKTPWDGKYHGLDLPVGTYFYIIKTTPDAKPIAGDISIVR